MDDYIEQLTEAQRAAVTHGQGPLLILAGPGSGKTRVITCRVARLIESNVSSDSILALTFTNKAAEEMRHRVASLVPYSSVWMSTFHRFCSNLLRRMPSRVGLEENFTIYDAGDSLRLLKDVVEESPESLTHMTPGRLARAISNAKNKLWSPEQLAQSARTPAEEVAAKFYPEYQRRLVRANAVDFDDLLMYVAQILVDNPDVRASLDSQYEYVLVDEYQDTNYAQYCIVRGLSVDQPNLAVTGDPDQAIYGWRGADIKNILSFERDYPQARVVRLEQNYRSTPEILEAANALISNNQQRKEKTLFTDRPSGEAVRLTRYDNEREEAEDIVSQIASSVDAGERRPSDIAILYRVNALSRTFEHVLREFGIPYQIVNGVEFYQRKEIKDILAYLQLLNNPRDRLALLRIINTPPRGIGKKTIQRLTDFADTHGLALLESARRSAEIVQLDKRSRRAIERFVQSFDRIAQNPSAPVEELVGLTISVTGYADQLRDSNAEEDRNRLANVEELMSAAREFDEKMGDDGGIESFLEQAALVNDTDAWENQSDKVTLMTLHAAKGLEFRTVFIVAVENEILPHVRAREDILQREEERRLFFVGLTRAKDALHLSFTTRRNFRGRSQSSVPSSFLMELPRDAIARSMPSATAMQRNAFQSDDDLLDDLDGIDDLSGDAFADELGEEYANRSTGKQPANDMAGPGARESSRKTAIARVTTAAALAGDGAESKRNTDPDHFEVGMLVQHPQHGPGKIIALSGTGRKRNATVQFIQPPQQIKFVLAFSPLLPLTSA